MECLNKGFDKWFGDFFKDLEEAKIFNDWQKSVDFNFCYLSRDVII